MNPENPMNFEDRLRDALTQRAESVEPAPGALFEIQRRVARKPWRVPEVRLRLRPALVLAAAACALTITLLTVTLTRTDTGPEGEIVIPAATPPEQAAPPTPPTTEPLPDRTDPPPAPEGAEPEAITTADTPEPPPPAPATPATPAPATPPPPPAEPPPPPEGEAVAAEQPVTAGDTPAVTVYFACGEEDAVARPRPSSSNDLTIALATLVAGPNEADTQVGCQGLQHGEQALAVVPSRTDRWLTVDFSGGLADALSTVTAEQFLTQLNATVFEFDDVSVAEYQLDGSCAAFGGLLGRGCEVHTRGESYSSELTAHTFGGPVPVVRTAPDENADELSTPADGTRLTDRSQDAAGTTWTQVITTAGETGWVPREAVAARPLSISAEATRTMERIARAITTGPGIDPASLSQSGLVVRWGADDDEVARIDTAEGGGEGEWWYRTRDIPSPRTDAATAALADVLWINGDGDTAFVTIGTPGPFGEPHPEFAALAYVSIYQAAVGSSYLPPALEGTAPPVGMPPAAGSGRTGEGDLPPPLPVDTEPTEEDEPEPPPTSRVQISVMFDFAAPDDPRVVAVEVISL